MSDQYKQKLKCCFDQADVNHDGCLSIQEVTKILRACGNKQTDAEIASDFLQDDTSGDKKLSFQEFWEAVKKRDPKTVTKEELRSTFKDFDTDGSGFITVDELKALLKGKYSDATIENVLRKADVSQDNKVSCEEFIEAWDH